MLKCNPINNLVGYILNIYILMVVYKENCVEKKAVCVIPMASGSAAMQDHSGKRFSRRCH